MKIEKGLLTKEEVAARYRVTVRTVTAWMYQQKRISFLKIGRVVRFFPDVLDAELRRAGFVNGTDAKNR